MRTLLSIIFSVVAFASFAQTTPAQPVTQKIGYADSDYIFSQLPEMKQIDSELKAHSAQLQSQMEAKQRDLQTKYEAFQKLPATTDNAIRADKQRELEALNESLQKFSQDAQTSLQNKQNTLMAPVFDKVGKAIEAVAKENGFAFIISAQLMQGADVLLYSDEKFDISPLVLKKMGVTATKPATTPKP
ncbi:MAG TPA: OmpH family outer membrane protein [Cyclobacteriaceae bacterium]|nr:OmpH family outer membrane protein [Cyclobacteriaceae bacterium]